MSSLPALLIGGPPHRGKSVLSYILSKRLKTRHVDHYLIRITPDAEGNWYYEGNFAHTSQLRNAHKRAWDEAFELSQSQILENRPLPLLVDGGGQPTDSQVEELFGKCSHALLLCASEAEFVQWRQIAARAGLPVVGELRAHADLTGLGVHIRIDRREAAAEIAQHFQGLVIGFTSAGNVRRGRAGR